MHAGADPSWANTFRREHTYYDKLWRLRDSPEAASQLYMQLAESVEQVDESTFAVKLKQANFHNNPKSATFNSIVNGRQFTAEDVAARYAFQKDAAGVNVLPGDFYTTGVQVTAIDDLTLQFSMDEPFAFFLEDGEGVMAGGYEVPREMLGEQTLKTEPPIGTGPYMFDSYEAGGREVAVRNPDYFVQDRPYIDKLQYTVMADAAAQAEAFRTGLTDVHDAANLAEAEGLAREFGNAMIWNRYPGSSGMALMLNARKPLFQDARMREAIHKAIDVQRVIDVVYSGDAARSWIFSPARSAKFPLGYEAVANRVFFNKRDATALVDALKVDGIYGGEQVHFMLPVESQNWVDAGRLLAEDFEDIGLNVRAETVVQDSYLERAGSRPSDGSPADFDITLTVGLSYTHFHSRPASSWVNASPENPELDAIIERISLTVDSQEREKISHEFENWLADNYGNFVPVLDGNSHTMFRSYVKNIDFDRARSGRGGWQVDRWLDEGRAEA
jgi:ABC-type transport system substrate-binding protein